MRCSKFILSIIAHIIRPLIPNSSIVLLNKWIIKRLKYTGYSYPEDLMKFKYINFLDVKIPVPMHAEKYLELTYGKDWRIPNKDYIWFNEAKNLLKHDVDR